MSTKITFGKITDALRNHAIELNESKDKTASYRAASYERAASKVESNFKADEVASADKLNELGLTDYMKSKVSSLLQGKKLKSMTKTKVKGTAKAKDTKVKSRSRSKSKSKSPTRSRSRSKSKNNIPTKANNSKLIRELTEFMGLGPEKASVLVSAGLKSVNQLHSKKYNAMLPEETKLFLSLKPEQKIPHEHIDALKPYIEKLSKPGMKITIVGSYRRGKPFSSDIDCMIVSEDENIVDKFIKSITKELNGKAYPYSKGTDKLSIIIDMSDLLTKPDTNLKSDTNSKSDTDLKSDKQNKSNTQNTTNVAHTPTKYIYKLDAFRTTPADEIPMLLYSTGSKEHNISMRASAKKQGMLLNQKGLFLDGKLVPDLNSEKDYFDALGLEYKEPSER